MSKCRVYRCKADGLVTRTMLDGSQVEMCGRHATSHEALLKARDMVVTPEIGKTYDVHFFGEEPFAMTVERVTERYIHGREPSGGYVRLWGADFADGVKGAAIEAAAAAMPPSPTPRPGAQA